MNQTKPHVVIVEDNDDAATALQILFRGSGYTVSVASTAAQAFAACRSAAAQGSVADLMLLDLSLPDASGLDALEAAVAARVQPRITVALTGDADPDVAATCRAAGCHEVMVKPVGARELLGLAARWLGQRTTSSRPTPVRPKPSVEQSIETPHH